MIFQTHYRGSKGRLCGQDRKSSNCTNDIKQVTCKKCLRSLSKRGKIMPGPVVRRSYMPPLGSTEEKKAKAAEIKKAKAVVEYIESLQKDVYQNRSRKVKNQDAYSFILETLRSDKKLYKNAIRNISKR